MKNNKTFYLFWNNYFLGRSDDFPKRYSYSEKTIVYDPVQRRWFRMDITPMLDADVPNETKLQLLLLT